MRNTTYKGSKYFHTPAPSPSRVQSMENDGESCRKTSSESFHTPVPSPTSQRVEIRNTRGRNTFPHPARRAVVTRSRREKSQEFGYHWNSVISTDLKGNIRQARKCMAQKLHLRVRRKEGWEAEFCNLQQMIKNSD